MTEKRSKNFPQNANMGPLPQELNEIVFQNLNSPEFLNSKKDTEVSIGHLYELQENLIVDELGEQRNFYGAPEDDMMIQVRFRMSREDFANSGGIEIEKRVKDFKNDSNHVNLNDDINSVDLYKSLTENVLLKSLSLYLTNHAETPLANRMFINLPKKKVEIKGYEASITFEDLRKSILSMAAVLDYKVKDLNPSAIEESLDLIAKMINSIVILKISINRKV